jgi:DNA-binding NarL/FixJ family response regulator
MNTRKKTDSVDTVLATGSKPYRVLVADDHAVVRRGLRSLLESQPGIEVCCEAATGPETLQHVKTDKPDLVVLDLTLPEMNGLDVTRALREQSPSTAILVLTMHFSEELAREVLRAGAMGYVLKSDADGELLAAIDHVRHNQPFFTSALAVSMAHTFVHGPDDASGSSAERPLPGSPLTNREVEVIQLLAEGKSNKEAALELGVSTRTVESHRNHIMHKMNFRNFSELVRFAVRNNLVEL